LKEVTGKNALYFSPKDSEKLKELLIKAYKGEFDKDIKEKAYLASKNFSWKKTAEETLKVYESSVKEP
jgi:glycosyltransferase involved in cell wall biosynthesis